METPTLKSCFAPLDVKTARKQSLRLASRSCAMTARTTVFSFDVSARMRLAFGGGRRRGRATGAGVASTTACRRIAAMSCRVSSACALTLLMRALSCLLSRSSLSGDISKLRRWTPTISKAAVAARLAAVLRRMALPAMLSEWLSDAQRCSAS